MEGKRGQKQTVGPPLQPEEQRGRKGIWMFTEEGVGQQGGKEGQRQHNDKTNYWELTKKDGVFPPTEQ